MLRSSSGKRKSAGAAQSTPSAGLPPPASASTPATSASDSLETAPPPFHLSHGSLNRKRIRAAPTTPTPATSDSASSSTKATQLSLPPPFPPERRLRSATSGLSHPGAHPGSATAGSSSSSTLLVSNAELELHSPDESEAAGLKREGREEASSELSSALPELESELPSSSLSTLSPSSVFRSPVRHRPGYSALLTPSPLRSPSPSSPSMSVFRGTPSRARFSPSSGHSAFFSLSPMAHHQSTQRRSPRLSQSPASALHSPGSGSSTLFRSPHRMSSRTPSRGGIAAGGSLLLTSPSPSRARSLHASLNMSSLALPHSSSPLPSLLSPTLFSEAMTPSASLSSFAWDAAAAAPVEPAPTAAPLTKGKKQAVSATKRGRAKAAAEKAKGKGPGKGRRRAVAEVNEDSVDSLAALLPAVTGRAAPSLLSPSHASLSFPSTSLLSSRELARSHLLATPSFHPSSSSRSSAAVTPLTFRLPPTPSSSTSRSSTSSSSSSKRTSSFSIIGANSPSPSSSASVRVALLHAKAQPKVVRQRLTFEAQQPHAEPASAGKEQGDKAHREDVGAVKADVEAEKKESCPPSAAATARRLTTEFVMSEDGLLERSMPCVDGEQRALFAYRATAGSLAPARFPPPPISDAALSPLRPRSYTFAKQQRHHHHDAAGSCSSSQLPAAATTSPPSSSSPGESGDAVAGSSMSQLSSTLSPPPPGVPFTPAQALASLFAAPPPASGVISIDGVPVKAKACACKKSQCLKCFAHGRTCVDCNCVGCHNTEQPQHQQAREKAIQATRDRDANAFYRAAPLKAKAEAIAAEINAATHTAHQHSSGGKASAATPSVDAPPTGVKEDATAAEPPTATAQAGVRVGPGGAGSASNATAPAISAPSAQGSGGGGNDGSGGGGAGLSAAAAAAASSRKGCNCRKSRCLKKYCECYQLGLKCTARCKCEHCANGQEHAHDEEGPHAGGAQLGHEQPEKVKGVFVNVPVESHHTHSTATPTTNTNLTEAASSSSSPSASSSSSSPTSATTSSVAGLSSFTPSAPPAGRDDGPACAPKLSTWKLLPTGSAATAPHGSLLHSNAPPIPVTPLGPFTLPAPFELFQPSRLAQQPHGSSQPHSPTATQLQPADTLLPAPLILSLSNGSSFLCELGEESESEAVALH